MNFIALIILIALIGEFILGFSADVLNLKTVTKKLPESFAGYYDAESYAKSQDYLRVTTRFGWIVSIFNVIVILAFWFGKGFPMMDHWVKSFHNGPVVTGIIYMGILILFYVLFSQPFNIYSTFVIEQRFGFNKTTQKTYISDIVKGLAIAILLGGPLLAAILAFFQYIGHNAWLYCWIVVSLYLFIIQFMAPAWIMPVFNKFEPLEDGELKNAILTYAGSVRFPLKNVYVMDGSKRSGKSNAFFTGFGKNKRIVLFDTLIEQHTVSELVAILAHEIGHYKKKHIVKQMVISILQMGVMFFLLSFFVSYKGLFDAFYMEYTSVYAGLIFFGMLYSPIDIFMGMFIQMLSRKNEYEADRFAVETTKDPKSLAVALKKLSVHNLSNLRPHPFYVFLNYSHPPVLDRIEAIYRNSQK